MIALADNITVSAIKEASLDDLIRLYKEAGWWESSWDGNPEFLRAVVRDSAVFAGAFLNSKLIGMGRALSDLASDAYIQDVVVLNQFRGQGIGKRIILYLIERLKENGVDWIGLVAMPGAESFYRKLGFEVLCNHVPLIYRDNDRK